MNERGRKQTERSCIILVIRADSRNELLAASTETHLAKKVERELQKSLGFKKKQVRVFFPNLLNVKIIFFSRQNLKFSRLKLIFKIIRFRDNA